MVYAAELRVCNHKLLIRCKLLIFGCIYNAKFRSSTSLRVNIPLLCSLRIHIFVNYPTIKSENKSLKIGTTKIKLQKLFPASFYFPWVN